MTKRFRSKKELRIGTRNVKTMSPQGRIHNAIKEMTQMSLNFIGISEMR